MNCLQVSALGAESKRLQEIHPDHADAINTKQTEIEDNWTRLKDKVNIKNHPDHNQLSA